MWNGERAAVALMAYAISACYSLRLLSLLWLLQPGLVHEECRQGCGEPAAQERITEK